MNFLVRVPGLSDNPKMSRKLRLLMRVTQGALSHKYLQGGYNEENIVRGGSHSFS